jgi:hypothetical protein
VSLPGYGAAGVFAAVIVAVLALAASPQAASADHVCSAEDAKVESSGNDDFLEYTTPAGQTVEAVCIKAGNRSSDRLEQNGNYDLDYDYLGDGTANCYFTIEGIGTETVSVTRNEGGDRGCDGTGSGLSNMEIYYCRVCPTTLTPEPSATEETPEPTATEETPGPTSTQQTPAPTSTQPATSTSQPGTATPTEESFTPATATSAAAATQAATPVSEVLAEVAVLSVMPPTTGSGGLLGDTSNVALGFGLLAINIVGLLLLVRARAGR